MDPTEGFFAALKHRGHEPRLEKVTGSVRFDIDEGNQTHHWLVSVQAGDIAVSRRKSKADAVIHTDRKLFNRIVTGQANAMASTLRGLMGVEGDPELSVLFQRFYGEETARP